MQLIVEKLFDRLLTINYRDLKRNMKIICPVISKEGQITTGGLQKIKYLNNEDGNQISGPSAAMNKNCLRLQFV
uniref:Uncharacterized protein n=1 Tax=Romanomermis culicivorax TaxID=13658 RepID=A0A915K1E8_ROMCU